VSTQPEALRLADSIEGLAWDSIASSWNDLEPAADELRRLHAMNAELLEALKVALDASWNGPMPDYARDKACAAIAKAEGVQS
jgi:hypothetical protein